MDLYNELCVLEALLCLDLEVDHLFDDGVAAILFNGFEGVFFALGGFYDEDVAAGALTDLSVFLVLDAFDLDLVIQFVHLIYMGII